MSDSNWSDNTKAGLIVGIITAILISVTFIGWGLSESAEYEREADYRVSDYAEYTNEKVTEACVGVSPVERFNCLNDAINAEREYKHDQKDLVAQRQSALWAYIMGTAAVVGMGLSVIGVFLVWTTFQETRRTADAGFEANRIQRQVLMDARANQYPFVWLRQIFVRKHEDKIQFRFVVANVGNTPALSVMVIPYRRYLFAPEGDYEELRQVRTRASNGWRDIKAETPQERSRETIRADDQKTITHTYDFPKPQGLRNGVYVQGVIFYQNVWGEMKGSGFFARCGENETLAEWTEMGIPPGQIPLFRHIEQPAEHRDPQALGEYEKYIEHQIRASFGK